MRQTTFKRLYSLRLSNFCALELVLTGRLGLASVRLEMASQGKAMLVLLLLFAVAMAASAAGVYGVGGQSGWTFGSPSTVALTAGDTVRFSYPPKLHNVWRVSKQDYDSCQSTGPIATYDSGNDYISLPRQGAYYFICAVEGHCAAGMKVAFYVD